MQISSAYKTIFAAGIALLIISCNSGSKDKVKIQEVALQEIKLEENNVEPPPPPGVDTELATKRCFANEGLKFKTVVTIYTGGSSNLVTGNVVSKEMDNNTKQTKEFAGMISGDKLTIRFKGTPPVTGAASEWTDKSWTLKKTDGKETLLIVFNAKNYDTNKWSETDYLFEQVDCINNIP